MTRNSSRNTDIADIFECTASLLAAKGENTYRTRSYRGAADVMQSLDRPAAEILREDGKAGLEKQCTLVTTGRGSVEGKRLIRGKEGECREYCGSRGN